MFALYAFFTGTRLNQNIDWLVTSYMAHAQKRPIHVKKKNLEDYLQKGVSNKVL